MILACTLFHSSDTSSGVNPAAEKRRRRCCCSHVSSFIQRRQALSEGSEINPPEMPIFSLTRKQLLFYKVSPQRVTHDFLPMLINL